MEPTTQAPTTNDRPEPHPVSPYAPGERSLLDIMADLRAEIPRRLLKTRKQGGSNITYLPWYRAVKLLDYYAPGWDYAVEIRPGRDRLYVVARISLTCSDGVYTREATGCESLDMSGYGDPSSNAESMALRRAAAKLGLGLYLYEKDK